jgi:hypothetical protein
MSRDTPNSSTQNLFSKRLFSALSILAIGFLSSKKRAFPSHPIRSVPKPSNSNRLNMRSANLIYRDLQKFLETVDAEATARGEGPEDSSIDQDFRSGVHLGVGLNSLVLSLLPSRASTVMSLYLHSIPISSDNKLLLSLL